ncbi:MAG: hypothetical protein ACRENP_02275 [Longimicrobiales bacterium]
MKEQAQRLTRVTRTRRKRGQAHSSGGYEPRTVPADRLAPNMVEQHEPLNVWVANDRRQRPNPDPGRPLILVVFDPDLDRATPGL